MRVLFAIDGSEGSFEAVRQVGALLTAGQDDIAFYCSPPEFELKSRAVSSEMLARARGALASTIFAEATKRLPEPLQAGVHTILGTQDPRTGIVTAADQWPAQLVVVGARGLGMLDRLLLGSVSRAVVHGVRVPVWVARSNPAPQHSGMRLLLACDDQHACRPQIELLTKFAWPAGTECQTVTVVASMLSTTIPPWLQHQARSPDVEAMVQAWSREHDESLRAETEKMQAFVQALPPKFPACKPLVVEGEPTSAILAAIARTAADLVIMGVRRKRSFAGALLGSASEAVLNHASCSVLIVPQQDSP